MHTYATAPVALSVIVDFAGSLALKMNLGILAVYAGKKWDVCGYVATAVGAYEHLYHPLVPDLFGELTGAS